jgi:hypothetical protein
MSLFFISSPIGSGKTRAIAELCSQPAYSRRNVLFTSPTISLLVQTGEEIRRAANGLSPTIIHSQQSADSPHGDDPAVERLKDALISSEQGAKVLCTHKTLLSLMSDPHWDHTTHMSRWCLFMDETCEVIQDHYFRADSIEPFSDALYTVDGELKIKDDYLPKMQALAAGVTDDDSLMAPRYRELIRSITSPLYKVWGSVHETHIAAVSVINPYSLTVFSQVVLLSALFSKTLTSLIWTHTFDLNILPFKGIGDWWHDPHAEGDRLSIYHVLPDGVEASVSKLGSGKVASEIAAVIASYWKDEEFIYSCNKTVRNPSGKSISNPMKSGLANTAHGKHIKTISHGLNSYDNYSHSHVASLAITQPDNALVQRVATLAGISAEITRSMYRLHTVYQTVGRCAIRKKGTTCQIEAIVLDKTVADQLAAEFTGSVVLGQLGNVQCEPSKKVTPQTRPEWLTKAEWANVNRWLTANRENGLAGALKETAQAKFDEYYKYSQHFRDQQCPFDIEPDGFTVAAANDSTTNSTTINEFKKAMP